MSSERAFDVAAAKLNLALHVRATRPDGRHDIETLFAFCIDGDRLGVMAGKVLSLSVSGPFAPGLGDPEDNLVLRAARALKQLAGVEQGAEITLEKRLPIASGLGGGSADAAAALRLLTALWKIDPAYAQAVAPELGSDVPACLLGLPARGTGAGDELTPIALPDLSGTPVLLVNPRVELSTAKVFAAWDGTDGGPLGDWRDGGNDLEAPAKLLVPQIASVLAWLGTRPGVSVARMSGSGATCFALFDSDEARDRACDSVPREWWRLPTGLR
ncbi:MAG: 4-(cytidine 5'-diphospho)-2-C-methyl-D-erythritol kinase [Sphingomicrobium sp.]